MAASLDDDWLDFDDSTLPATSTSRSSDIDRNFDRRDFLRLRLKIFKDEYRETAHESEAASTQRGFEDAFGLCIGFCRRLGRAKGALKALRSKDDGQKAMIHRLLEQIDSFLNRSRNVQTLLGDARKTAEKSEFDMEFAVRALVQYDADDMELFLGEEAKKEVMPEQTTSDTPNAQSDIDCYANTLKELELEADRILVVVCDVLHSFGICDAFIYA